MHSQEQIKKQVKIYIYVFATLGVLTVLTVGVSYLKLPWVVAIALALFIALVKSSLVAGFFMHLISEKKIIWFILLFAIFLFIFLLLVPAWHLF